jgi:hypothetical protein
MPLKFKLQPIVKNHQDFPSTQELEMIEDTKLSQPPQDTLPTQSSDKTQNPKPNQPTKRIENIK